MRCFPLPVLLAACGSDLGGIIGDLVEIQLRAEGEAPFLWSRTGSIPGVVLEDEGGADAFLRGRPEAGGTFRVIVTARDAREYSGNALVMIDVKGPPPVNPYPPVIGTERLPVGIRGKPYRAKIELASGGEPLAWSATGLPAGLVFDERLYAIEGVPLETGTFEVGVRVEDPLMRSDEASYQLVSIPALEVVTSSLPDATVGALYRADLEATGGKPPYRWRVASNWLPEGLAIFVDEIAGTPSIAGTFDLSLEVTDTSTQAAILGTSITVR